MRHFEFRVMAIGLIGAPATFHKSMNTTLAPLLRKCVFVFFDDILVSSPSWESHLQHLRQVLELLAAHQWKIKMSKCSFTRNTIAYLGHIISTDQGKIEAISAWPVPSIIKELRSFLGLAGYYRKFVQHFGVISQPLTKLLKKRVFFVWSNEQQVAFDTLKQALISALVLALPNFSRLFVIETDAYDDGVGAALMQDGHPLAFLSKALGPKSRGLST
jgi:hypothetical protein